LAIGQTHDSTHLSRRTAKVQLIWGGVIWGGEMRAGSGQKDVFAGVKPET
jgi:hypothetical protein